MLFYRDTYQFLRMIVTNKVWDVAKYKVQCSNLVLAENESLLNENKFLISVAREIYQKNQLIKKLTLKVTYASPPLFVPLWNWSLMQTSTPRHHHIVIDWWQQWNIRFWSQLLLITFYHHIVVDCCVFSFFHSFIVELLCALDAGCFVTICLKNMSGEFTVNKHNLCQITIPLLASAISCWQ